MLTAILTQRETIDSYGVLVDSLESGYISFFEKFGVIPICFSNFYKNPEDILSHVDFDFSVLTGGGEVFPGYTDKSGVADYQANRDITEKIIIKYCLENKKPILGICRGFQFLNGFFGGVVSKLDIDRPIAVDHTIILRNQIIKVNNYHNDGVHTKNLASGMDVLGIDTENDVIEAFYSNKLKILAMQFHPERKFSDLESLSIIEELISNFINNEGELSESHYFSSRRRNET